MNVNLTPALEEFIAKQVATGHFNNNSEVVRAALRLLVREYEKAQKEHIEYLRGAIAEGLAQVERGEVYTLEELKQSVADAREQRRAMKGRKVSSKAATRAAAKWLAEDPPKKKATKKSTKRGARKRA
jgi:antitoxin ParD1/3/4